MNKYKTNIKVENLPTAQHSTTTIIRFEIYIYVYKKKEKP